MGKRQTTICTHCGVEFIFFCVLVVLILVISFLAIARVEEVKYLKGLKMEKYILIKENKNEK